MTKMILAVDEKNGLAKDGEIPWKHKDDMKFFKNATTGHGKNAIIMGRKTKQSLGDLFPLPNRMNYVISTSGEEDFISFEEVKNWINFTSDFDNVFIIGGASIYFKMIKEKLVDEIYISTINGVYDCDLFFNSSLLEQNYRMTEYRKFDNWSLGTWTKKRGM